MNGRSSPNKEKTDPKEIFDQFWHLGSFWDNFRSGKSVIEATAMGECIDESPRERLNSTHDVGGARCFIANTGSRCSSDNAFNSSYLPDLIPRPSR